jgi:hypothetical protein
MKRTCLLLTLVSIIVAINTSAQKLADPILLWPNGAPGATGNSDEDNPAIIPFVPEPLKQNGAAVLVVPGGGFTIRAVDHEGVLVAQGSKTTASLPFYYDIAYDLFIRVMNGSKMDKELCNTSVHMLTSTNFQLTALVL